MTEQIDPRTYKELKLIKLRAQKSDLQYHLAQTQQQLKQVTEELEKEEQS